MSGARRAVVVILALVVLVSCARRGDGRVVIGERQERRLAAIAARAFECDRASMVVTPLNDRVYQVHGCGRLGDYAWSTGRRRGWVPLEPVYQRAAAEMSCPAPQLAIAAPAATVRHASGCGRSARYDLVCGSIDCAWMMTAHGGGWADGSGAPSAATASAADPSVSAPEALPPPPGASEPARTIATGSDDGLVIPAPPASGSAEAILRALLDARRADVHRCAGAGVISVRAVWGDDGAVLIGLEPPLAGSPAEECVRSSLAPPPVAPGAPGSFVHPVL